VKLGIHYDALYRYEQPVGFSPHVVRLFPKTRHDVVLHKFEFETNMDSSVHHRRDIFDNDVAFCFYWEKDRDLRLRLDLDLEVQERNAFDFILASHAVNFPFSYKPEEARVLAPYLGGERLDLPFWTSEKKPTVQAFLA